MTVECKVCGSANVVKSGETETYTPPFGSPVSYLVPILTCADCGERTVANDESSATVLSARDAADRGSIDLILNSLSAGTNASIERSLRLPARTLWRWKSGECSAAAVALLRCVRTFPWILSVADHEFDPIYAEHRLVMEGTRCLGNRVVASGYTLQGDVYQAKAKMGRPKMAKKERRSVQFAVRVTTEAHRSLEAAARASGLTFSEWVRRALTDAASRGNT